MATVTITFQVGAQTTIVTLPDAAVERLQPMVESVYRPLAPDGATLLESFAAGLRYTLLRDLRKFERRAATWTAPVLEGSEKE